MMTPINSRLTQRLECGDRQVKSKSDTRVSDGTEGGSHTRPLLTAGASLEWYFCAMVAAALGVGFASAPVRLYASSRAEYFIIKLCISLRFASRSETASGKDGVGVASSSTGLVVAFAELREAAGNLRSDDEGVDFSDGRLSSANGISTGQSFRLRLVEALRSATSLFPARCGLVDLRGLSSEWFDLWRIR